MAREEFGQLHRELRLRAGYGLRRFAKLIGELPSNLSAMECGSRASWRSLEKLRTDANALGLEEGSLDWERFFIAARRDDLLPGELGSLLEREETLVALRTINEMRLSDEELRQLVNHLRSQKNEDGRKRTRRRSD
jgi:transcriptional regulator with XRE-family HTH domain